MIDNDSENASEDNATLTAALAYATEDHLLIFPVWGRQGDVCSCGDPGCKDVGKHPNGNLVPHGFRDATSDPEVIRAWFDVYPDAGIGCPTGAVNGIIVPDLDIRESKNGLKAVADLDARLGPMGDTLMSQTPSGGRHRIYAYVEGIANGDKLKDGIDIRSDGAYMVLPPSHGMYRWVDATQPIAQLPDAWVDYLRERSGPTHGVFSGPPEADAAEIAEALAVIPNDADKGWDDWNLIGMAASRATGGSEDGFRAFDAWSSKCSKYDQDTTRQRWEAYQRSPPTRVGAGAIFYTAHQAAPGWRSSLSPEDEKLLDDLAKLSGLAYERRRSEVAKELGVRKPVLDKEIAARRELHEVTAPFLQPPKPWPDEVDGVVLLDAVVKRIRRHVVLSEAAALAVALWIIHAHAHDAATHSPLLTITAPLPQCGKTTLLSLAGKLVPKPLPASNITPSTVFRAIELWRPTLLIDEADTFVEGNSELRGIINSGHERSNAFTLRNVAVGDNYVPQPFSTWGPKAIALIGKMHATLWDRSIVIELTRRLKQESIERVPRRGTELSDLQRQTARWATDNLEALRLAEPDCPDALTDRGRDNWEPLLAIANRCGKGAAAREAALQLADKVDEETRALVLLADFRVMFAETDKLHSKEIIVRLIEMEDRPWAEFKRGKAITANGVAQLLKPFKISPSSVWINGKSGQGYQAKQFTTAWERFLPPVDSEESRSSGPASGQSQPSSGHSQPSKHSKPDEKAAEIGAVSGPQPSRSGKRQEYVYEPDIAAREARVREAQLWETRMAELGREKGDYDERWQREDWYDRVSTPH